MGILGTLHLLAWATLAASDPTSKPAVTVDPETIAEVTEALRSNEHDARQRAVKDAVEIGGPIVPALLEMVLDKPGQGSFDAQCALRLMGAKARPALPRLLKLVEAGPAAKVEAPKAGNPPRLTALQMLRHMGWAADEVVPALKKVADNPGEEDAYRRTAVSALGGMGKEGIAILRKMADGPDTDWRELARKVVAQALQEQGIQTRAEYFTALVEADLLGPHTPDYLRSTKTRVNMGVEHALTQKVKSAYRARLKEKPDAPSVLNLALIIQDGLGSTAISWMAPTDSVGSRWTREDRAESFATMAEAMTLGLKHAEKGSKTAAALGIGMAKLRLLQGDWEGMNQALEGLGWSGIPARDRPWLAAPPKEWNADLGKQWTVSDEKLRSGTCGLVVHVEKDGQGLRGAHVLVKKAPEHDRRFDTGIPADNLHLSPLPLGDWSFGYIGRDRALTRYAITDATGEARLERLPEMDVKLEVLIPTANFPEAGRAWDLYMEVEPGTIQRAEPFGGEGAVDANKPPAVVELQAGRTVEYPRLIVLPQLEWNVRNDASVDPDKLELIWPAAKAQAGRKVVYELDMILSGPSEGHADAAHMKPIRQARATISEPRWPVGAKGVGGLKLAPGHIYVFSVTARDENGRILGRAPSTCVWTPWKHRQCAPPVNDSDTYRTSPIQVETWHLGNFGYGDGRSENLQEKVERFLREYPDAFEREYVQVGKAWLDWDGGDKAGAQKQLEGLVESLPAGSVPQATAHWLLESLDNGDKPPRRLKLVAPSARVDE